MVGDEQSLRKFLITAAPLAIVVVAGLVAIAGSSSSSACAADEDCAKPARCVAAPEARRVARAATRSPGRGLAPIGFNDGSIFAGQASAELVAELHREIGAGLIRFALDWRRVEPEKGRYDFSAEDEIYCAAIERGIAPVIAIAAAPAWAAVPSAGCEECLRPPDDAHLDDLRQLAAKVARRYPGAAAIEAWNEPNIEAFWENPDPERYVEVLRAVAQGVKRSGGGTPVLGGALANYGNIASRQRLDRFLTRLYELGGGSLMDAISIHPYPGYPIDHPRQRYDEMIEMVISIAGRHGLRDQPIWITELGLRTDGGADHAVVPEGPTMIFSPDQQAGTMASLFERASRDSRIKAVIFHTLIEPDGRVASHGGYGWISPGRDRLEAKPVWCRIHSMVRPERPCASAIEVAG